MISKLDDGIVGGGMSSGYATDSESIELAGKTPTNKKHRPVGR